MRRDAENFVACRMSRGEIQGKVAAGEKRMKSQSKYKKKNSHTFQICYTDLCNLQSIPMIFCVKAHLHRRTLDFNADRVKLEEWRPILKALSLDRTLHFVAIRSRHSCSTVLEKIDTEAKARTVQKLPVLFTKFLLKRLVESLSSCLSNNTHITCLELDGIPLLGNYLDTLIMGLRRNTSLQHISFRRCAIGDHGCQQVSSSLRIMPSVISIDLSACEITSKGAHYIAKTLQFQNLNRYGENWKQSLRYRTPNTDMMPGLRRVTLNHNPDIGDMGMQQLADVLRDDLWLKALDLQNTGLTSIGGNQVLELLHVNKCLEIVDIRNNPEIDLNLLDTIMTQVAENNFDRIPEYYFLKDDALCLPRKPSYVSNAVSSLRVARSHSVEGQSLGKGGNVRLTRSNILPLRNSPSNHLLKTVSAAAVLVPHSTVSRQQNQRDRKNQASLHLTQSHSHPGFSKARSARQWRGSAGGDNMKMPTNLEEAKERLRDLSSRLKEESQKRLDAEKQTADLEERLKSYEQEIKMALMNSVLVDKKIMEAIISAFADFNGFLTIIYKTGLVQEIFETAGSEVFTSLANSLNESYQSLAPSLAESNGLAEGYKNERDANKMTGLSLQEDTEHQREHKLLKMFKSNVCSPAIVAVPDQMNELIENSSEEQKKSSKQNHTSRKNNKAVHKPPADAVDIFKPKPVGPHRLMSSNSVSQIRKMFETGNLSSRQKELLESLVSSNCNQSATTKGSLSATSITSSSSWSSNCDGSGENKNGESGPKPESTNSDSEDELEDSNQSWSTLLSFDSNTCSTVIGESEM